ncbi:MAG: hypothetical protein ABUL72_01915, partial [Armatimonadota bacterium]
AGASIAACAASASAQLVVGTTTPTTTNGSAFYLDPNTPPAQTLWNSAANKKVNGLAADTVNGKLYSNDAARLNFWNYGSVGTVPTFIAGMYRTNDNVTFTATGVNDLTFANGNLYGVTTFGSTVYKRGIYQINITPDAGAHCVMTPIWTDPTGVGTLSGTIDCQGLEFNPADNLFYVANMTSSTAYPAGVYTIDAFGSGTASLLTAFPAGGTHIDGLTIGGGKVWLTMQSPSTAEVRIFSWDMTTHTYDPTTLSLPLTDVTQRASAAVWAPGANLPIPAPATGTALLTAGLIAARRRRPR